MQADVLANLALILTRSLLRITARKTGLPTGSFPRSCCPRAICLARARVTGHPESNCCKQAWLLKKEPKQ